MEESICAFGIDCPSNIDPPVDSIGLMAHASSVIQSVDTPLQRQCPHEISPEFHRDSRLSPRMDRSRVRKGRGPHVWVRQGKAIPESKAPTAATAVQCRVLYPNRQYPPWRLFCKMEFPSSTPNPARFAIPHVQILWGREWR